MPPSLLGQIHKKSAADPVEPKLVFLKPTAHKEEKYEPAENNQSPDNSATSGRSLLLSDLLPYDPIVKTKERLKDGLKEYLLLLTLAEQAMESILNDELFRFDPLVGENACQIRAVKIALILRNNPNLYQERLDSIQFVKNKVKDLLATSSDFRDCDLTLKDVLNKCELNVRLTDDDKYLINSYILTTTKVVQPFFKPDMPLVENAYTDYKKIKEIIEVGSSFSCELIKKLRKDLAEHSSNYVTDVANNSSCQKQSHLLSEQYLFVHNGLKCLPYYWATRALMLHAKKNQLPIVMLAQQLAKDQDYKVVKNTQLFFISTPSGYQKTCRSKINPNDPVIVLVGSTCRELSELPDLETWENELLEQCPLDLVLSYAAAHRQYPNESHMLPSSHLSDADYEYHKAKAKEWGCSMINPSRFFLTHTFCDKIKNIEICFNELCEHRPKRFNSQNCDENKMNRYSKLIENVGDVRDIWKGLLNSKSKAIFFYQVIMRAIHACQDKDYTAFDAHTTSNCCHGMALLVKDLISVVLQENLNEIAELILRKIEELESNENPCCSFIASFISDELLALGSLYILAFTRVINEKKRMRTEARNLQSISSVGVSFCWKLVNSLKIHFSNLVANSYFLYAKESALKYEVNGVGLSVWGKYVENDYIRIDKRGIKYVSCIYSTQVSLAHLVASGSKVAMVNDIINSSGEFVDRLIWLFQGDGFSKLQFLNEDEIYQLVKSNAHEPIVVFAGYMYSDSIDVTALNKLMSVWKDQFPCLMIACDVNYPQFPQVSDDPNFNSDPIIPEELSAKKLLASHAKILGVSQADPSLFCSSHTYTSSLAQLHSGISQNDEYALPSSFHSLRASYSEPWAAVHLSSFL